MARLGLGTVQFGLDYGISNRRGRTTLNEVCGILAIAAENGVRVLDTATTYGESEAILGTAGVADSPMSNTIPATTIQALSPTKISTKR